MSLTHRGQRRARKRARVPVAGGHFVTRAQARRYVLEGLARLNDHGELDFSPASERVTRGGIIFLVRPRDVLEGRSFHWYPSMSGGVKVMKGRASRAVTA